MDEPSLPIYILDGINLSRQFGETRMGTISPSTNAIYINYTTGSDYNPGTLMSPFKHLLPHLSCCARMFIKIVETYWPLYPLFFFKKFDRYKFCAYFKNIHIWKFSQYSYRLGPKVGWT